MRAGNWNSAFFYETLETTLNAYRLGAELENHPADRVPWYEARVRKLKEFELLAETRVKDGVEPPHQLNIARFHRHGAEAELLVLLDEVKKAGLPKGALITRTAFEFQETRPTFTAFPNLKPPILVQRQTFDPTRDNPKVELEEKDLVPVPPLPVRAIDAPVHVRVRYQQLRAGLDYLRRTNEVIQIGSWTSQFLGDYLDMLTGALRSGAEFERTPDRRVAWLEARVARLKGFEKFTEKRVREKHDPPHRLCLVRLCRLQAEVDLLKLATEVSVAPSAPLHGWPSAPAGCASAPATRPY
jgi:hypothetical protein